MSDYEWSDRSNDELSREKIIDELSQYNKCTRELAQTQTVLSIADNNGTSECSQTKTCKSRIIF